MQFRGFAKHGSSIAKGRGKNVEAEKLDRRAAEQAACQVVKKVPDVQEVRRGLPPTMGKMKHFFCLNRKQRDELEAMGFAAETVQGEKLYRRPSLMGSGGTAAAGHFGTPARRFN